MDTWPLRKEDVSYWAILLATTMDVPSDAKQNELPKAIESVSGDTDSYSNPTSFKTGFPPRVGARGDVRSRE